MKSTKIVHIIPTVYSMRGRGCSIFRVSVVLALLVNCGCRAASAGLTNQTAPQILQKVKRGVSQKQVEALIGVPARHEFTASPEGAQVRCVSYYFASYYLKYYFVFTNDALWKIILPPRFEHELSAWDRGNRAVWKSHDPQERMEVVLQAQDLDEKGITVSIEHRYKPKKFDNALPAAIVAGVIGAPIALVRGGHEYREIRDLAQKFDPYRVRLGMRLTEVETIYGAPHLIENLQGNSEIRYYGSPKLGLQNPLLWVSVIYRNEEVSHVFSDDFFNYRKLESTIYEK